MKGKHGIKPKKSKTSIGVKIIGALGIALVLGAGGVFVNDAFLTDAPAIERNNGLLNSMTIVPDTNIVDSGNASAGVLPELFGQKSATAGKLPANGKPSETNKLLNAPAPADAVPGDGFGLVEHSLFGELPIVQGTKDSTSQNQAILDRGAVVHYESTALPGEIGNFSVSGHRITHGAVFQQAVDLKMGDVVKVTTADKVYNYKVIHEAYRVEPHNTTVTDTNPLLGENQKNTTRKLMSIITCGNWLTNHREVISLELVEDKPKNADITG